MAARLVILSAGSIEDPAAMPGVAQMTANMLTQGTEKRSAKDIADAIDFVGGSLEAAAGKDSTTVTLDVVKKDLDTGLDLMSDVVLHPAFQRGRARPPAPAASLKSRRCNIRIPNILPRLRLPASCTGSSPYGWPERGHARSCQENCSAMSSRNSMMQIMLRIRRCWDSPATSRRRKPSLWPKNFSVPGRSVNVTAACASIAHDPISGLHIWLVDKPDAEQTQIRVGKIGIRRADPDYIPLAVTNRIFGGGYNSRLNTEVRVKKGLTYGAFSAFNPHRYSGAFTAGTYTRTEATVEATKLVVDLIAKMSTGDVTQKELDFARDYLAGVYPIQSETAEQVPTAS